MRRHNFFPYNIPLLRKHSQVIAHINARRAFNAPNLLWQDTGPDGKVLAQTRYNIAGQNYSPMGIKRSYVLTDHTLMNPNALLLYVYDYQTHRWYANDMEESKTAEHPCRPANDLVFLVPHELRYLSQHGVVAMLEAKLNGTLLPGMAWGEPYRKYRYET